MHSPVVLGGTGGSGTRAAAAVVASAGRFMGARVNAAGDALDLAEFDWRWGLDHVTGGPSEPMRAAFEEALERHLAPMPDRAGPWGWKHPHAYLMIALLAERFPALRFVHVLRDATWPRPQSAPARPLRTPSDPCRAYPFPSPRRDSSRSPASSGLSWSARR